jgi:plasmid stabilization system protein ParE
VKAVWAPLAETRALEAVDFIARERSTVVAKWLEELLERTAALSRFPRRGREVPEIARPPYREIQHAPYRIIYRIDDTQVVILTVRHWRRAWDPAKVPDGV